MIPIILGSDKTTMSVATGQHDYYPLNLSVGNLHNMARRVHKNGVKLIAFLAMPKSKLRELISMLFFDIIYTSYKGTCCNTSIPQIPSPAIPSFFVQDTQAVASIHVQMENFMICRWLFSAGHLHARTLHCRLQRTSAAIMHCVQFVPKVSKCTYIILTMSLLRT